MGNAFMRIVRTAREQGYTLAQAWELAKRHGAAMTRAEDFDLVFSWEDEQEAWEDLRGDLEDERPAVWACAVVYEKAVGGNVCRASLGGIGLNSMRDAYVWEVEADLLNEAIDAIEAEHDACDTQRASELASRATYAGVSS